MARANNDIWKKTFFANYGAVWITKIRLKSFNLKVYFVDIKFSEIQTKSFSLRMNGFCVVWLRLDNLHE